MSYKLSWYIPGRVIDMALPALSNDEALMLALDDEMNAMLDTASQPVSIIIDVRTMQEFPLASVAMKLKYYKHQNTSRLIVIGLSTNPILRFLGSLVGRGVGIQIKDFGSREEAIAYLGTLEQA